jgi:putative oxidoreductase
MDRMLKAVDLPARLLLALLFLVSGATKLAMTAPLQGYMQAHGVPGALIWPAAAWELAGGALLLVGLGIAPLALLMAGWCVLTAVIFHTAWGDLNQLMNFFKNMTMAGGLLIVARHPPRALSLDGYFASRRGALP